MAQREQARGLLRGLDEGDGVGQDRRLGVLAVRVVFAQRGVGGDPLAQEIPGGVDDRIGFVCHSSSPDGRGLSGGAPAL